MKKTISFFVILFLLIFPTQIINAQSKGSEIHITSDGKGAITNLKVIQIAGSTIFARLYWGEAYVRITLKTNEKTKILRGTGEGTTIKEFNVGDFVDVKGELESGDTLSMNTTEVKNSSLQKAQTTLSGTIKAISGTNLTVQTTQYGSITIETKEASIKKGTRSVGLSSIKSGEKITSVSGDYDLKTKVLKATKLEVYVDMKIYEPKVHIGTITTIGDTTLPTILGVKILGVIYEVNLPSNVEILNTNRVKIPLSRFEVGDTLRIYGKIRELDEPILDAEVIRNISL